MSAFLKHVHIIINPISGTDYPILPNLVRMLNKHEIDWDISITKSHQHAAELAAAAVRKDVDAVAVYGGDGTLMEVAGQLAGTKVPLIILPGGTANVLAKELGVPLAEADSLKVFGKGRPKHLEIDMGVCNKKKFVLRVNVGIFADMIKHATQESKDSLGQLSYVLAALDRLGKTHPANYKMILDGQKIEQEGIGLIVANSGNIGISGVTLAKEIKVDDGFLDVLVVKSADIATLTSLLKGVLAQKKSPLLEHFRVKTAKISISPQQSVLQDDLLINTHHLDISLSPKLLTVLL